MDLPDLKSKVRISTADIDVADAKVKAFGRSVNDTMDRVNVESKMQAAGQAFVKFGDAGEITSVRISSASARSRADLDSLEQRARTFAEGLDRDFTAGGQAIVKLGEDGAAALGRFSQTVDTAVAPSVNRLTGFLQNLNPAALGVQGAIIALAATLALVLSPAIASLLGQLAILSEGFGILGFFGVLGVAAVLLAQRVQGATQATQNAVAAQQQLTQATNAHQVAVSQLETLQNSLKGHKATANQLQLLADLQKQVATTSYDLVVAQNAVAAAGTATATPMQRLQEHVGKVADALGQKLAPSADKILTFLDGLIDPIAQVGSQLASWFGDRLPQVLVIAQDLFDALGEAGQRLVEGLAPIFDKLIQNPVAFEQAFQKTALEVVDAVVGLVKGFDQLAEWWTGPQGQHFASQAGAVMDLVGTVIQGAITVVEALTSGMSQLGDGTDRAGRMIQLAIHDIGAVFDWLGQRADDVIGKVEGLARAIMNLPVVGGLVGDAGGKAPTVVGATPFGKNGRASGGPVVPGSVYTVGETGPETLVMGSSGGYVVPGAGSAGSSTQRTERLLDDIRGLLMVIAKNTNRPSGPTFSMSAWPA